MGLYSEKQFLKSQSYSEIASDAGFSTGYCPHRDGWIIRDKWDEVIGWWWPKSHRLSTVGRSFGPVTFSEAIRLLVKGLESGVADR